MAVAGTEVETGLAEGDAGNRAVTRARLQSRLRLASSVLAQRVLFPAPLVAVHLRPLRLLVA